MIDQHNVLAHTFRIVRNYLNQGDIANIRLRLYRKRSKDARVYNLPSSNEVAALIVGDFDSGDAGRDIIVQLKSGHLQRIHETHTAFIPLQYPMMFPYGEDGYQEDIPLRESHRADENRKRQRVSLREFIAFRIQERKVEYATIVNGGRLFQQFLVDCFSIIEAQRLTYYRNNQTKVRSDIYKGIQDAVVRGETRASKAGKRIILPASFTGGMRYMFNNCQDAMAICKKYGYPDLFITMTCNSSWQEIGRVNNPRNLKVEDRPDISCRVFKIKLDMIISDLKQGIPFGVLDAGMYTVEFQKRGLPHAHILLWLSGDHKITTTTQIDQLISSELPDPAQHPKLFRAVSTYMIHGPCGRAFSKSPCMKDGYCTKYYPKTFSKTTVIDDSGYPSYRRRDTGVVTEKKGVHMDNRNVVPYNAYLLMSYQAHVNVEYCNKSNAIKYLFKYVNKGPDRVAVGVTKEASSGEDAQVIDEIKQFYDCRYLSACEAVWRTLAYDIHQRWPSVMRLTFHLPGEKNIIFKDDDDLEEIVEEEEGKCTMFLAWMEANKKFEAGQTLTYAEFPNQFVYDRESRVWHPRKRGYSIGRLNYVPPGTGDIYYMRILLAVQRGCTTYESIRTVNGITYSSFQDACYSMGLLCDDREFIAAINEVAELASGHQLRKLFAMLLISNSISNPERVWNATWTLLANGILYERRKALKNQGLSMTDDELKNLCLIEIEKILNIKHGSLKAELLIQSSLIIWDEAPMLNKMCFEALDRTLRDLMSVTDQHKIHQPFGGKVVVLGGDFRQILPVIPKGSRHDILASAINSSHLWSFCKVLKLHTNMRLLMSSSDQDEGEMKRFANWILDVGNGNIGSVVGDESEVEIPNDLLITTTDDPLSHLVDFAYPNLLQNMSDYRYFQSRAILAPTLESVEKVNDFVLTIFPGMEKEYLSSDTTCQADENEDVQQEWFTPEFLNDIKCSGLPNHKLTLKPGVAVMLLRNIDQTSGLCNGTRLIVNELGSNVIGATVVTGRNIGDKVYIPRMNLIPSDSGLPFKFQRRQFPLTVCFAMTINKSQGQSLSHVGLYLSKSVFTHGQLYVALSRVKSRSGLRVLILDEDGNPKSSTTNVVFKEVFNNI
ncbi:hypothetical protein AAHE18_01G120100 [Arachis hypogaea]